MIIATAPNDNQKPGPSTAQGSINSTANNAKARIREALTPRPTSNASATAASLKKVRCVGTEKPAISE